MRARARYVRTSARKARMVCGHLRGKSVQEARAILAFTPREVARDWSKLLESAVANAESNHELLEDDLIVREAYADEGPTIKRFRPRAMGRATPIRKRTSHLTITLVARPEPDHGKRERARGQMGQKVHPEAMRVGYIHDWKSNWFNDKGFAEYLAEDIRVREHITDKLAHAGLPTSRSARTPTNSRSTSTLRVRAS